MFQFFGDENGAGGRYLDIANTYNTELKQYRGTAVLNGDVKQRYMPSFSNNILSSPGNARPIDHHMTSNGALSSFGLNSVDSVNGLSVMGVGAFGGYTMQTLNNQKNVTPPPPKQNK